MVIFFIFSRKKYDYKWIPEDQNLEITGFWKTAKNVPGLAKKQANFFAIFVKREIKPLGKLVRTQKTDYKNLFSFRGYRSLKLGANPLKRPNLAEFGTLAATRGKKIFVICCLGSD